MVKCRRQSGTRLINKHFFEDEARAVYAMWRKLPPFNKWNLPLPSKIIFEVIDFDDDYAGQFLTDPLKICLSLHYLGHFENIAMTMAHEMVHLKLFLDGKPNYDKHDKTFRKLGDHISQLYGFDPTAF